MSFDRPQLQPLVLPHPSHTKQLPAGLILVPQVKQSGESTAVPVIASSSSADVCACFGAGFTEAAPAASAPTAPSAGPSFVVPLSDSDSETKSATGAASY